MTLSWLLVGLVVLIGALVQGSVGYGMNMIAAPLLALIEPMLVPVPVLVIALSHAVLSVAREHSEIDWHGVGWSMLGRVPGTVLGVMAVVLLAQRPFSAVVGAAVLICVVLSVVSWRPRPRRGPLLVAGVASGVFGTASSIGGPPLALLYQHSPPARIRSTMAACFVCGTSLSLAVLALSGQVHERHLFAVLWLLPFLLAGFLLSGPVRRLLHGDRVRVAVLTVAAISAVALIGRSLVG